MRTQLILFLFVLLLLSLMSASMAVSFAAASVLDGAFASRRSAIVFQATVFLLRAAVEWRDSRRNGRRRYNSPVLLDVCPHRPAEWSRNIATKYNTTHLS